MSDHHRSSNPTRYILRVCRVDRYRRNNPTMQEVEVSVPCDMTVQEMVKSVVVFLDDDDEYGHYYTIKTPNHLQILSALNTSPYPVGLGEPDEYVDFTQFCEETGYPSNVHLHDLDQEGERLFVAWRRRVKHIRKGDEVLISQTGLQVGGPPMTMEYNYGKTSSFDIYLAQIRAPEGEEVGRRRFRHAMRPLCRPEDGIKLPPSLRIPPELHLSADELFYVQYLARLYGVRSVQEDMNNPEMWHTFKLDKENDQGTGEG